MSRPQARSPSTAAPDAHLHAELLAQLSHGLRPMAPRDPQEPHRTSTPLELLYDLFYVIAFARAAGLLAEQIASDHAGAAFGAYLFAVFTITWAWMNFTWFASAYDNDDAVSRIGTLLQMVGVLVLTFGLPESFEAAAQGRSPNNGVLVAGYIVMRVPLLLLWLRAARSDRLRRGAAVARVATMGAAQVGWAATTVVPLPAPLIGCALVFLAAIELIVPVVVERDGLFPWNAGHLVERFGLLTLVTLGEVVAAVTTSVGVLVHDEGWSLPAVVIAVSGVALVAGLWWAYFTIPSAQILDAIRSRVFAWRYAHLLVFGSLAAIGAGIEVVARYIEQDSEIGAVTSALAVVIPVGVLDLMIFVTWSAILRRVDPFHIPLFLSSLLPLVAAVIVVSVIDDRTGMLVAVALTALSPLLIVVGHEAVGYRHTVRAVEQELVS